MIHEDGVIVRFLCHNYPQVVRAVGKGTPLCVSVRLCETNPQETISLIALETRRYPSIDTIELQGCADGINRVRTLALALVGKTTIVCFVLDCSHCFVPRTIPLCAFQ